MATLVDVPSGSEAGRIYLIEYSEDLWYDMPEDRRELCRQTWIERATAIENTRYVTLRLFPDELFPMHGNEKPYVAWQHEIDRPPECGFTLETEITVTLSETVIHVDPVVRMEITRQIQLLRMPAGTPFVVVTPGGNILEHGKI